MLIVGWRANIASASAPCRKCVNEYKWALVIWWSCHTDAQGFICIFRVGSLLFTLSYLLTMPYNTQVSKNAEPPSKKPELLWPSSWKSTEYGDFFGCKTVPFCLANWKPFSGFLLTESVDWKISRSSYGIVTKWVRHKLSHEKLSYATIRQLIIFFFQPHQIL